MNVHMPAERVVIAAVDVAGLLGLRAVETFYNKRQTLEERGFPKKLPGINGWSRPAILRWIETNGETYLPEIPAPDLAGVERLERRYAR